MPKAKFGNEDSYEEKWITLREKSILGECGYSVNLSEEERRWILEGAVNKHGRYCVIDAIKRSIQLNKNKFS